jgi:N-methylhydantoinase B
LSSFNPARLEIFRHLFGSVADEMGVTLGRTAYSPNIKERQDYSCALFLGDGRLLAQAAHIPVHLGAMPASVRAALEACAPFAPGDVVILNDPTLGGTHLPDITLVSPVFVPGGPAEGEPPFLVASRAHHADVGGMSPGSMPLSTELYQEGLIIPPLKLVEAGRRNAAAWRLILRNVRTPAEREGDLAAQLAAHAVGERRALAIVARYGLAETLAYAEALLAYTERLVRQVVARLPAGPWRFADCLEAPDGRALPLAVSVWAEGERLVADFAGTAPADSGNLNAVRAIVESAAAYVLRCLAAAELGGDVPMNAGAFAPLEVRLPPGSLLDAPPESAVAAGNVETSQRVVDVLWGALAQALPGWAPAASQGTMNNLTFGGRHPEGGRAFAYYETLGGGAGAGPTLAAQPGAAAASGVHVHMSNTRNTPIEALEHALPVRVERYTLRRGTGGAGRFAGGDGLVRDLRFLVPVTVTVLAERRAAGPWGLAGGHPGAPGDNVLLGPTGTETPLPGKFTRRFEAGEGLSLRTPGGGGWGG